MIFFRKLKPPTLGIESVIGITVGLFALLLVLVMGLYMVFALIALVIFIYVVLNLLIFIRTFNYNYLILSLFLTCCTSLLISVILFGIEVANPITVMQSIIVFIFSFWVVFLVLTRKLKWRTREILELAALPVKDISAGYTQRPLPVGRISSSKEEIMEFAKFIHKNLMAIPYVENGSVVISINAKLARQVGLLTDYLDTTWVRFDKDGNVSVNISRTDYLKYKDELSFDQLCNSLGNLFIEFHDQFLAGEGIRIIDKIDSLRLNPITE